MAVEQYDFEIKDSGARQEFAGGMVRDTQEGKLDFISMRLGPMYRRWAAHLTAGRTKYPDAQVGVPNWTLAKGPEEYERAKSSAARHFEAWINGERDEDHAAGVFFNINLAEYVLDRLYPGSMHARLTAENEALKAEAHSVKVPLYGEVPIRAQRATERAMGRETTCCGDPADCGGLCDGGF